jgi:MFS family permease
MYTAAPAVPAAVIIQSRRSRTILTLLLALSIFINYIDRGNLATAAPLIKADLHLTTLEIGLLTSAFFWIYTPGQLVAGWVVDRLGGYVALGLGFALWSLATGLTGLAGSFALLLGFRVLLGIGETVAFPSMSKLLAQAVPPAQLGLANGFTTSGTSFGPAIGVLAGGLIIAAIGWRPMFLLFGVTALLWLPPWMLHGRSARAAQPTPQQPPPYRAILIQRGLWGTTLGHFSYVYGVYFTLSWMPLWLVERHGYSLIAMARLLALVYATTGTAAVVSGWMCDRLIGSGWSITAVRKSASILAHVGGAAGLLGCAVGSPRIVVVSLLLAAICHGAIAIWPIAQTLSGPRAAGRWVGVQNCLANTAGIIGPPVTGWIVDRTGSFQLAFVLTAVIVLLGALAWGVIVPRIEPVDWESEAIHCR